MNTFTDTPELRAKAKQEGLDKLTKYGHLLSGENATSEAARRAVRSNHATTLFTQTAAEREESAGRLPAGMALAAIRAGASRIGANEAAYARPGVDRTIRPRLAADREPIDHGALGRQRMQEYQSTSGGADPSSMPPPPVRAPLSPRSANASDGLARQAPRAQERPRGVAARTTNVKTTLGRMAAAVANDPYTLQSQPEQAQAMRLRDERAAGSLPSSFTSRTARFSAGAGVGGSEPTAGSNPPGLFPAGATPPARFHAAAGSSARVTPSSRAHQPSTAGQAGASGGGGGGGVRERRRVQVEEEDASQHAQEVPPVSLGDAAPAAAQVHQAPPTSTAPPSPSEIVALEKVLMAASPQLPEETVSHVRGSSREVFNYFSSRSARYSPASTMTCRERMRFWTGQSSNARVASMTIQTPSGLMAVDSSRESNDFFLGERTTTPERTTYEA